MYNFTFKLHLLQQLVLYQKHEKKKNGGLTRQSYTWDMGSTVGEGFALILTIWVFLCASKSPNTGVFTCCLHLKSGYTKRYLTDIRLHSTPP